MSVRTALAKLSAAAAGGALIGGAVHVAEPQAAETSYRSAKMVKTERPRYIKRAERTVPPRERTIRRVVEPFLIQLGLVARTARGRCLNDAGWNHLGITPPAPTQTGLFGAGEFGGK